MEPESSEEETQENPGYTNMLYPPVEDVIEKADSKFSLVLLSAQRANDINTYYQGLGSGTAGVAPPQVGGDYSSYLSVALEEIAQGKTILSREPPPQPVLEELPEISEDSADGPEEASEDSEEPKEKTQEG